MSHQIDPLAHTLYIPELVSPKMRRQYFLSSLDLITRHGIAILFHINFRLSHVGAVLWMEENSLFWICECNARFILDSQHALNPIQNLFLHTQHTVEIPHQALL
jgi:hypothetical protein